MAQQEKKSWLKQRKKRKTHAVHMPIAHMIPNMVTLTGMLCGLWSIRWSFEGEWEKACIAIIGAYIADTLDGGLARLLKASSRMGAELDSLADVISFGVAPAFFIHYYTQTKGVPYMWPAALLLVLSIALRLARFNVTVPSKDMEGFFYGVPSPPAAIIAITPIVLDYMLELNFLMTPFAFIPWLIMLSILIISKIPTFSFKKRKLHKKFWHIFWLIFCAIITTISLAPWNIFVLFVLIYLLLIPYSIVEYKKRAQKSTIQT
ncbi:MAG: phosphatidylcholine/phosphatidylserine synthase [Alphaproteobacteria bacterium]|nr:phosphatidylcholine/phosphatidylserine synthase [Alphaproteobacteria bacterium]